MKHLCEMKVLNPIQYCPALHSVVHTWLKKNALLPVSVEAVNLNQSLEFL